MLSHRYPRAQDMNGLALAAEALYVIHGHVPKQVQVHVSREGGAEIVGNLDDGNSDRPIREHHQKVPHLPYVLAA